VGFACCGGFRHDRDHEHPEHGYVVEIDTDDEPATYTKYFAHVYVSVDKAKAGVEH
jgi:hypothetical protein